METRPQHRLRAGCFYSFSWPDSDILTGMTDPIPNRRWFCPRPGWLVPGLLVMEGLLWLSDRFRWLPWHNGYAVLTAVASLGMTMLLMLGWFAAAMIFRWHFQFSIRSLLVLTVAVALPCNWLAIEMQKARHQREAVNAINNSGGIVQYDLCTPAPIWLKNLFGEDLFADVIGVGAIKDAQLKHCAGLPRLQELELDSSTVTDEGLVDLAVLAQLQRVSLNATNITDEGVAKLQQALPNCKIDR